MSKKRMRYSAEFKAKVALEAIREQESVPELAQRHKLHVNQIYQWKRELLENMASIFERRNGKEHSAEREAELLKKIGELTVERDFLARGLGRTL